MENLMTVEEVAAYVGVPKHTVYQWASQGTGPVGIKVGRYRRYRRRDVESWLDAKVKHETAEPGREAATADADR